MNFIKGRIFGTYGSVCESAKVRYRFRSGGRNLYLQTFSSPVMKNATCLDMTSAMLAVGKDEAEKPRALQHRLYSG